MSATAGTEIYGAFSNDPAYNVSFTTNGAGQVVASANVTAAPSPVNVTGANGSSVNAQTIAFSNANGVTLGVSTAANGATVTGSHNALTSQSNQAFSASGGSSAFQTLNFGNANGFTFSNNAGTVVGSYTVPTVPTAYVSSVNGSSGAISLNAGSSLSSSTNGSSITFGLASDITTALQSAGAYLTTARASNDAIGLNSAVSNVTATINSSGLSLDARGYAGTGTSATNASVTLNSNGLAISVAAPGGAASQTIYATGNTTVNSSGTVALSSVLMRGYGIVSLGTSNGSILVSSPDSTSYAPLSVGFSTGGNTAGDTGFGTDRVVFAGGANITLSGSTNAGSATISIVGGAGGGGFTGGVSTGGNTSGNTGTQTGQFVLAGGNNITLSVSTAAGGAQTITISGANAGGAQTGISGVVVSNTTYTSGTISFADGNGISFGSGANQAVSITHGLQYTSATSAITSNALNTSVSRVINLVAATNNTGGGTASLSSNVSFSAANGLTFYTSAGNAIVGSHNGLTTARASNDAIGLNTAQSNVTWTVNSSGLSLDARGYAGTGTSATNASITLNSAGLAISVAAPGGGVNPVASASNGSFSFTTLNFSNANNVTFGTSAGSIITASVAAPGAAAENNWVNLLGANTAGNTTASGSTIGYSGINLTLSGTNGSVVNISAPATSSLVGASDLSVSTNGSTISVYNARVLTNYRAFENGNNTTYSSLGQNSLYLQHFIPEDVVPFSYVELWARGSFVSSSNSQAYSQTIQYGIYTQDTGTNSTRMTLAGSSSNVIIASYNSNTAYGFTVQDGATSFTTSSGGTAVVTNVSGPFHHYMPFTSTLQPNVKAALAIHVSSTTAVNTGAFRYAPIVQTIQNSLSQARLYASASQAANASVMADREMGVYSVTTGALPSSYATSQLTIAVSRQQLPFVLDNG